MVRDPFAGREHSPAEHFRLCFYGGLLLLRELAPDSGERLVPYLEELRGTGLDGRPPRAARMEWDDRLAAWESASAVRLPLCDLREAAGLDRLAHHAVFPPRPARGGSPHRPFRQGPLAGCWADPADRVRARRALTEPGRGRPGRRGGRDAAAEPADLGCGKRQRAGDVRAPGRSPSHGGADPARTDPAPGSRDHRTAADRRVHMRGGAGPGGERAADVAARGGA